MSFWSSRCSMSIGVLLSFSSFSKAEEIDRSLFIELQLNQVSVESKELVPITDLLREPGSILLQEDGDQTGSKFAIEKKFDVLSARISYEKESGKLDYEGTTQQNNPLVTRSDYSITDLEFALGLHSQFFKFNQALYLGYAKVDTDRTVLPTDSVDGLQEEYSWNKKEIQLALNKNLTEKINIGLSYSINFASSPKVGVANVPANPDNESVFFGEIVTGDMDGNAILFSLSYQLSPRLLLSSFYEISETDLEEGTQQELPIEGSNLVNMIVQPAFLFDKTRLGLGIRYYL